MFMRRIRKFELPLNVDYMSPSSSFTWRKYVRFACSDIVAASRCVDTFHHDCPSDVRSYLTGLTSAYEWLCDHGRDGQLTYKYLRLRSKLR